MTNEDTITYERQCPVCGERVSIESHTGVRKFGEAQLNHEMVEHLKQHSKVKLLYYALKEKVKSWT